MLGKTVKYRKNPNGQYENLGGEIIQGQAQSGQAQGSTTSTVSPNIVEFQTLPGELSPTSSTATFADGNCYVELKV